MMRLLTMNRRCRNWRRNRRLLVAGRQLVRLRLLAVEVIIVVVVVAVTWLQIDRLVGGLRLSKLSKE
jgi:hypothetical protein